MFKHRCKKRWIAAIMACVLMISVGLPVLPAAAAQSGELSEYEEVAQRAYAFLLEEDAGTNNLLATSLWSFDYNDLYYKTLTYNIKSSGEFYQRPTDLTRNILNITAAGIDPSFAFGYNLLQILLNTEHLLRYGNNALIQAVIALNAPGISLPSDCYWSEQKLVQTLLSVQNEDGGFPPDAAEVTDESDGYMTALAITALSPYQEDASVQQAIDEAISFLKTAQNPDGSFMAEQTVTSESTAAVIVALTAAGVDPLSEEFAKNGKNLYQLLMSYQNSDGGFAHTPAAQSDVNATEQAMLALYALDKGKSPYDLSEFYRPSQSREDSLLVTTGKFFGMFCLVFGVIYLALLLMKYVGRKERQPHNISNTEKGNFIENSPKEEKEEPKT